MPNTGYTIAGPPMTGIDSTGQARVVQTDKDGKLMVSGVMSGGGSGGGGESTSASIGSVAVKTPNNTATFPASRAIYIGGFGDITLTIGGTDVTLNNLAIGVWHPISATAIKVTGTTATNIIVGY